MQQSLDSSEKEREGGEGERESGREKERETDRDRERETERVRELVFVAQSTTHPKNKIFALEREGEREREKER